MDSMNVREKCDGYIYLYDDVYIFICSRVSISNDIFRCLTCSGYLPRYLTTTVATIQERCNEDMRWRKNQRWRNRVSMLIKDIQHRNPKKKRRYKRKKNNRKIQITCKQKKRRKNNSKFSVRLLEQTAIYRQLLCCFSCCGSCCSRKEKKIKHQTCSGFFLVILPNLD